MNKSFFYLGVIALLAVFGVATYVVGYSGPAPKYLVEGDLHVTETVEDQSLGAMPSPDVYIPTNFHNTMSYGGPVFSTSTAIDGSVLSAKEVVDYQQIDMLYTGDGGADGVFTTTLPASSTMPHFLPDVGSCAVRLLRNTHATAASTTSITAGDGTVLMEHTAAAEVINGGNDVVMTWCREANGSAAGDFTVKLEEYTDI